MLLSIYGYAWSVKLDLSMSNLALKQNNKSLMFIYLTNNTYVDSSSIPVSNLKEN